MTEILSCDWFREPRGSIAGGTSIVNSEDQISDESRERLLEDMLCIMIF